MTHKKVVAIVQAHMNSTRLPGKVMLDLNGEPVINRVVKRLSRSEKLDQIVVASPANQANDILSFTVPNNLAGVYRGQGIESDVLNLTFCAAQKFDADIIVRITSDCPLTDPNTVDRIISTRNKESVDYTSNIIKRSYPRGLDVEVFTMDSFENVFLTSKNDSYARQHVTPEYKKKNTGYSIQNVQAREKLCRTDLRLTLDQTKDYILLKKLFCQFQPGEYVDIKKAIDLIDKKNLFKINESVEQKE